jgi:hypothetical protein
VSSERVARQTELSGGPGAPRAAVAIRGERFVKMANAFGVAVAHLLYESAQKGQLAERNDQPRRGQSSAICHSKCFAESMSLEALKWSDHEQDR